MSHYYLFAITSLIAVAIPGPDFLLVFQTSIRKGRKAGVLSAGGIACGLCVHGLAATVGLSAVLLKSAQAFEVVKWAGALYLVYLAGQLIIDLFKTRNLEEVRIKEREEEILSHVPSTKYVLRGFLTNVLNVKAVLFFVAIVPQFVSGRDNVALQLAVLSIIEVVIALAWFSLLAITVHHLGVYLKKRVVKRWLDGTTAAIFLGLAARLATTTRT